MTPKKLFAIFFVVGFLLLAVGTATAGRMDTPVDAPVSGIEPPTAEINDDDGNTSGNDTEADEEPVINQYHWRHRYRNQILEGVENETVVIECNVSNKNNKMYIHSYEYQKGMTIEIKQQQQNKLEIKVAAEFKEGKVLVLNIEDNAFRVKNANKLEVKFDGKTIEEAPVDEVLEDGGTEAKYTTSLGSDGGQYIVYIPHFSEHTITLEDLSAVGNTNTNLMLAAIGACVITLLILVIIVVKIKKD